jgi:NADH-quinone oxidoreductase subunit L
MVSLELKKALAYSTMSQIGYMMLGLGVAGLSSNVLIGGYTAGLYHLLSTGIHKAALFLCAGVIIKTSGSIYMSKMNLSREKMDFTWLFMWIVAFSLIGIPPFTGYWSKDEVLLTCWQSGQYLLYAIAWVTIAIKCFYTIRFMGMTFHKKISTNGATRHEKTSTLMLIPIGLLALMTIFIGLMGPYLTNFLHEGFGRYFTESLKLSINTGSKTLSVSPALNPILLNGFLLIDSLLMIVIGAIPAYLFYISHKTNPQIIVNRYKILIWAHKFLLERWHLDALYNKVFVNGMLSIRRPFVKLIEDTIDEELNINIPNFLIVINKRLKKIQTGILSINLLLILLFLAAILFLFLFLGVL